MAPRRFSLLAFDWDGTLADSTAEIVGAIESTCSDLGLPVPPDGGARQVIGLGSSDAISVIAPNLPVAEQAHFVERYRHHYLRGDGAIRLFPGVAEMLDELNERGFLLSVATGKSRRALDRALIRHGIADRFVASRCADEGFSKPHPDMLLALMDRVGADPARTLMIGDTTHDLELARNAGVDALAVAYGAHTVLELAPLSPLSIVHSVAQLRSWLAANA